MLATVDDRSTDPPRQNKQMNVVVLHGIRGGPGQHWQSWLTEQRKAVGTMCCCQRCPIRSCQHSWTSGSVTILRASMVVRLWAELLLRLKADTFSTNDAVALDAGAAEVAIRLAMDIVQHDFQDVVGHS